LTGKIIPAKRDILFKRLLESFVGIHVTILNTKIGPNFYYMDDYINFINQDLIDQGNMYFYNGNYSLAEISYQNALNKLRKYDGDKMHPMMLASELVQKIKVCKTKTGRSNSSPFPDY